MYRRSTNFVINRVLLSNQNILRNVSKINIVSPFEKVDLGIPRKCVEDQRNLKISMIWSVYFDIQNFVFLAIRLQQFWYRWKEEIHAVILSYSTSKSIYATTRYPQLTLGAPSFYLVVFKNKNKKSSKTKNEKSDQKVH